METLRKLRDQRIYRLKHSSGEFIDGTQMDLVEKTGMTQKAVSRLCTGERNCCYGWFNFDIYGESGPLAKADLLRASWREKQSEITLYHEDGRTWTGCQVDAPVKLGPRTNRHTKGWFWSAEDRDGHAAFMAAKCKINASSRGNISGQSNPNADSFVYTWKNIETNEVIKSTRVDMWKLGRCPKSGVTAIFSGRQKKAGKWIKI